MPSPLLLKVVSSIGSFTSKIAIDQANRTELVTKILKDVGLDQKLPPSDFDKLYAYTLVVYGVDKPQQVLHVFRDDDIRKIFHQAFEQDNIKLLQEESSVWHEWLVAAKKVKEMDINLVNEVYKFANAFKETLNRARTLVDIKQDQDIAKINYSISMLTTAFERVKLSNNTSVAGTNTLQKPIRIDHAFKTIWPDGIVENFDPSKELKYYIDNKYIIYSYPIIHIDVVSQAKDEWVKVAPFMAVKIVDIKPIPENVDYIIAHGKGAGRTPDFFYAVLSPNQDKVFGAPHIDHSKNSIQPNSGIEVSHPGYFTLEQGEIEVFILNIEMTPGYYYRFQVGIPYSYKGKQDIEWIKNEFLVGKPTKYHYWMIGGMGDENQFFTPGEELVAKYKMSLHDPTLDPSVEKARQERMQKYKLIVQKDTFFSLPS